MRELLILILLFNLALSAEPNPFEDGVSIEDSGDSIFLDDEPKKIDKMMFLDAVQKNFWNKDRKKSDNTINIKYKAGETHNIRTRSNMTTTFIFDNDKIASATLGDNVGFELKELGINKYDLSNILTIKPNLIGIDTNLTIIGESGNIYTFYIFSTNYKNNRNPAFIVFISEDREIGKINVENLEQKAKIEQEKEFNKLFKQNVLEEETDKSIIIGDEVNKIIINKDEIKKDMPNILKLIYLE
ncbi:MAG: TrbG/VirB9 family P-type conjugative transfer protein [Helicobacteraceae bacterium]|nr:TrbG/VirB9 family P-type conjugative transfer protein [Helicobacteraceae bacterium]